MLGKTNIRALRVKFTQVHHASTKNRTLRKPPDCKFENDDKECLPAKRCVPPTTVLHTLPKQKCVITVPKPQRPQVEIRPPERPEIEPFEQRKYVPPSEFIPWYRRVLPNEDGMSPGVKMAYRFLKFNVKALIAGGSVYATAKCGLWGPSEQTAQLYKDSRHAVASILDENAVKVTDVPSSGEIVATCKHYWNKGVIVSISSLVALPSNLKKWSVQLYKQISENVAPGASSKS